jgi:hypothetical protein
MATTFGRTGPAHPSLGAVGASIARPLVACYGARHRVYGPDSAYARKRGVGFTVTLRRGGTGNHLGIEQAGDDSAVAFIEVSHDAGINLICNNEQQRHSGIGMWVDTSLNVAGPSCKRRNRRGTHCGVPGRWKACCRSAQRTSHSWPGIAGIE